MLTNKFLRIPNKIPSISEHIFILDDVAFMQFLMILYYFSELILSNSQYLKKISVKAEDGGWYKCIGTNEMGWEENTFGIQVLGRFYSFISLIY